MKKPVAVIILNWNGAKLLREFLPSVCEYSNRQIADVIVADNGSTDNSLEILRTEFPSIKIIEFAKNYGFAEGYNRAIAETNYKYTILLNSDVAVTAGWIEPMFDFCEISSNTAACQPKLLSYTQKHLFEYAGACGGYIDSMGYPYCRGRVFADIEEDNGQYDTVEDIFWASGAALFVRTEVYMRAGGLDSDFFAHMEEIDLCWRIHLLGYAIKVIPQSTVFHLGGGSLPASNPHKTYLNFRNNLLLLHKNMPKSDGRKKLFVRRLYDTLAFIMFMTKCDFGNAKAILKAHRDFKSMRKKYNTYPPINLLKQFRGTDRNIIIDYYLRGKKCYE